MPFWYGLVFLITLLEVLVIWIQSSALSIPFAASAALWLLTIVYSITMLVPINNRIVSWEGGAPPQDWKKYRIRWDHRHRWRVLLLGTAFGLLILGTVSE